MPNYDFKKDHPIAIETEQEISKLLEDFYGWRTLEFCNTNAYDLKVKTKIGIELTIEVKEDFSCYKTGNVGIEFESWGRASGIAVSKAQFYLYKVHTPFEGRISYRWIGTDRLKNMIADERIPREIKDKCGDKGSNSKNYLFRYYAVFYRYTSEMFVEN